MNGDKMDFRADVIEKSFDTPVLVDFWAPWCGPCRVLGPTLERLAGQANGKWELVKVNVDENRVVATEYQIQGIPDLRLFHEGEVVGQFTGALSEHQIKVFLENHLPTPEKAAMQSVHALMAAGREREAMPILEIILEENPQMEEARALLAKLHAFRNPDYAADLAAKIPRHSAFREIAEDIETLFRMRGLSSGDLPESPVRDTYMAGIAAMVEDDPDAALERWIEVIMIDKAFDDEGARKGCVALFHLLGENHPVTQRWRRRFNMALY